MGLFPTLSFKEPHVFPMYLRCQHSPTTTSHSLSHFANRGSVRQLVMITANQKVNPDPPSGIDQLILSGIHYLDESLVMLPQFSGLHASLSPSVGRRAESSWREIMGCGVPLQYGRLNHLLLLRCSFCSPSAISEIAQSKWYALFTSQSERGRKT